MFTPKPPGSLASAVTITKSDTTIYNPPLGGIYVGGAGNIAVVMAGDADLTNPVVLTAVPVGTYLPINVKAVMNTNTTATLLIGFR